MYIYNVILKLNELYVNFACKWEINFHENFRTSNHIMWATSKFCMKILEEVAWEFKLNTGVSWFGSTRWTQKIEPSQINWFGSNRVKSDQSQSWFMMRPSVAYEDDTDTPNIGMKIINSQLETLDYNILCHRYHPQLLWFIYFFKKTMFLLDKKVKAYLLRFSKLDICSRFVLITHL